MNIYDISSPERKACAQITKISSHADIEISIPATQHRSNLPKLPECSELDVIRHFTRLSSKNFAIDKNFYPLGSCTMKYNPRGVHKATSLSGYANLHPLTPAAFCQGTLEILFNLQEYLKEITGMDAVSLSPMAGSQGEFTGVAMIKAYHAAKGEQHRNEMLIPDAAHGTNPASAAMCGFKIIEIPTAADGDIDLDALKEHLGPNTAGIMLTNPSTLGLFIKKIQLVADLVHKAGGLLYYDGANLNAILGKIRPGDMGFDVMHMNVHKTFATPHGGGGPGAGPVAVNKKLIPFLPIPTVIYKNNIYSLSTKKDSPNSIGRLSAFNGNIGILLRAYFYICMLGKDGLQKVSDYATLNANYLMTRLISIGYTAAYPDRRASHEFIISLYQEKKLYNIGAMDVAKALLDRGFHAPTTYFPLLIPECLLIEPTETESKQEIDRFINAMAEIRDLIITNPDMLHASPIKMPVGRLDDVKAAKDLDLRHRFAVEN